MNLKKYINELTSCCGISGDETKVSKYLESFFNGKNVTFRTDIMGNFIVCKKSAVSNRSVMVEAHIDEIGMLVKSIDADGFLSVAAVGGIDPRILPGNEVVVHGDKDYRGIVGLKPLSSFSGDDCTVVDDFNKLFIDVGMNENTAKENINIGDSVTFFSPATELNNDYIFSKCLDDRASCAILLDLFDKLENTELGFDLYFCFCVQEEVGLRGSNTCAYSVNPDLAIAIDVTHGKTPDGDKSTFECGCGPAICRGPNVHPGFVKKLLSVLNENDIPHEIEIEGGNTGTDAWSIQTAREGIPTLLLSIPLKYMHTYVETIRLSDCEKTSQALEIYLKSFEKEGDTLCY